MAFLSFLATFTTNSTNPDFMQNIYYSKNVAAKDLQAQRLPQEIPLVGKHRQSLSVPPGQAHLPRHEEGLDVLQQDRV
jgi:hypothetical protein